MARYPGGEYVPAKPFADWIEERIRFYDRQQPGTPLTHRDSASRVARDLGWGDKESGARKLYRYRHCLKTMKRGSRYGRSFDVPTDKFPRPPIEDALFRAGVDFYSVYPEYAHERDIELEPAAWCPACREHVTPIDGECPWDGWRISEGHMNGQVAA